MNEDRYPVEKLGEYDDDGTIVRNVDTLRAAVIGRKIVSAETREVRTLLEAAGQRVSSWCADEGLVLTLDNGTRVLLRDTSECCAYTTLQSFWRDPASVQHVITGVGTTGAYTTWHIYADLGDIMRLELGWSCGNPFYYGYGFDIDVLPLTIEGEVVSAEVLAEAQLRGIEGEVVSAEALAEAQRELGA